MWFGHGGGEGRAHIIHGLRPVVVVGGHLELIENVAGQANLQHLDRGSITELRGRQLFIDLSGLSQEYGSCQKYFQAHGYSLRLQIW
jgi:hypothetical protein